MLCLVAQLCLTLCDPMDCSPPGSSVHGLLQARILEWVAASFFLCLSISCYLFIWPSWVLVVACRIFELLVVACGIWFPEQGLNLDPLQWEHSILAPGPPGKSMCLLLRLHDESRKLSLKLLQISWKGELVAQGEPGEKVVGQRNLGGEAEGTAGILPFPSSWTEC